MKAKVLSFVFNNFSESGLFNGLRAKKIKQFLAGLTRVSSCNPNMSNSTPLHSSGQLSRSPVNESSINIIARVSGFGKKIPIELSIFLKSSVPPGPALSPPRLEGM
jgi:hypothetical protein